MTGTITRAISVAVFIGGIGGGVVFPIVPILGVQLGLSGALIGLILAANRLTRLLSNPVTGYLVDRVGGRWPLSIGLALQGLSTLCLSAGTHLGHPGTWFLVCRAVWGVGSSALIVGGLAVALRHTTLENRGRVTALVRSSMGLGMPAGLVVGGFIAGLWSNDAAFVASSLLSLAGAVFAFVTVRDSTGDAVDGGRVASPGAGRRAVGGQAAGGFGTDAAGGAAREARMPWRERLALALEAARPLFSDRRVATVWFYNFLMFFTLQGALITTLVLLVEHRRFSLFGLPVQPTASLMMAFMVVTSSGSGIVVGRLLDRASGRTVFVIPAASLIVVGFLTLGLARETWVANVGIAVLGLGMGGTTVPLLTLLGDVTPAHLRGRAVGLYQIFGDAGGTLGPIVGVDAGVRVGYEATYVGLACVVLCALPLAALLRMHEGRTAAEQASA